jgi:hypothetical protein
MLSLDPFDFLTVVFRLLLELNLESTIQLLELADFKMKLVLTHGGIINELFQFLILSMKISFLVYVSFYFLIFLQIQQLQFFE